MDYRLEQLRFELREDPSSRIFFKLGEHLRREGELDEAVEVLRAGLEQHPAYIAAWVSLGRALLDQGSSREAAEALARANELDPENAVACRYAGEAAIANEEWVEAVKALKRARAFSGANEALDERILFVEAKLAEIGQLEAPAPEAAVRMPPPQPAEEPDQPFDIDVPAAALDDGFSDVFDVGAAPDAIAEEWNSRSTMAVPIDELPIPTAPSDPVSVPDSDVEPEPGFVSDSEEAEADSDPALEIDADALLEAEGRAYAEGLAFPAEPDVVFEPSSEAEPDLSRHSSEAAPPEPVFEIDADAMADAGIEVEAADEATETVSDTVPLSADELVEAAVEPEAVPDAEPPVKAEVPSRGLPLPTMTLARLALDQGDLELAEKTLQGVLERDPANTEAADLLAALAAGDGVGDAVETRADDPGEARVRALRRWLKAVRLASERLQA